ncbi:MAG: pyridoxamine 5'-phosphate oxidase, partial [Actinobacteria bacterium]|nr:pyridoxamine 5'-phosphate oxidase [Actinomycetota bacterium]
MAEMTTSERDDFLSEVRVGVLAIERDDKGPLCAPVW